MYEVINILSNKIKIVYRIIFSSKTSYYNNTYKFYFIILVWPHDPVPCTAFKNTLPDSPPWGGLFSNNRYCEAREMHFLNILMFLWLSKMPNEYFTHNFPIEYEPHITVQVQLYLEPTAIFFHTNYY